MIKIITILFFAVTFAFSGPVSYYGALKACTIDGKGRICGSGSFASTAVQLRGVSLGWSNTNWESAAFFNATTVNAMVDGWKAEIIRVPLGYSKSTSAGEYSGSYLADKNGNMNRIKTVIDSAIAKDVYVIIDWHAHDAHDGTSDATAFFDEMAKTYGKKDNVIFEIFNEPKAISWSTIATYSNTVINKIRENSNNLILVGTPNWAQNVNAPVYNSNAWLSDGNLAYVLHFYAYSHALTGYTASGGGNTSTQFQTAVDAVLNAGKPVFVSEYGTTHSDGGSKGNNYNTHSESNSNAWHTYFDNNKISSVAWNINDKYEGSAFFGTNSATTSSANRFSQTAANFTNTNMMTASGKYIYNKLVAYAANAEWRNASTPVSFNPAIGNKIFAVNNGVSLDISGASTMQVFDLQGNLIRAFNLNGGSNFVSLNALPKKLYIVKVSFGSESKILNVPVR